MGNTPVRASLLSTFGVLLGLLCATRTASAGETTISVLGLEPAAGTPEQVAATITDAIRQRVAGSTGFHLVQGRDLVEVKLVFSCPDEAPACMTQAAQSIGAAKLIFGNLQPVGTDAYLVTLKLLDAERGLVETWTSEQISKSQTSSAALRPPVQKWFAKLVGQSLPGTLKVSGGVIGATVLLDSVKVGLIGTDGLMLAGVAAGPHKLTITKTGYETLERSLTLESGGTEKLVLQMKASAPEAAAISPVPEAAAPAPPPLAIENEAPPAVPEQGTRVGAWALLGVGMVAVGLGGYFSYKVNDINSKLDPYRRYPCGAGGPNNCAADGKTVLPALSQSDINWRTSQKNTGETYAQLQWVGYGVGAAVLATSGYLFYRGYASQSASVASNRRQSQWTLLPTIAPGSIGALAFLGF